MRIAVIADDVTGACDVASELERAGLTTRVWFGGSIGTDADAVVVALRSRALPPKQAAEQVGGALEALLPGGPEVIYQKYCSTFDSTAEGNIGPVADALLDAAGEEALNIGTPATPAVGRTQYLGHLFVGAQLLEHSSMRHHPLTPMRDSRVAMLLAPQTRHGVARVGRGDLAASLAGRDPAVRHFLLDAIDDEDLDRHAAHLIAAGLTWPNALWGGGAGLAAAAARQMAPEDQRRTEQFRAPHGRRVILAGSCSERTLEQVAAFDGPRHVLDVESAVARPMDEVAAAIEAFRQHEGTLLIQASAPKEQVVAAQQRHGVERSARAVETVMGEVARRLVAEEDARQLLLAGGETSGAVADALGIHSVRVGPTVAPGVPWLVTECANPVALLFKSGNYGPTDLFNSAWQALTEA